jgi:hypothetical protein
MPKLIARQHGGGDVQETDPGEWRLSIPAGPAGVYRWAQLDDHLHLSRANFPWHAPLTFKITARISNPTYTGTWGFGFWNDPFSLSFGVSGSARRLPALPNAAWFFHATPPNHLAFRDHLPGSGMLAGTFSSLPIPSPLLAPGAILAPLLVFRSGASLVRRLMRVFVREDSSSPTLDWTAWHEYTIHWKRNGIEFMLDGEICHQTDVVPHPPLGLVIWIDNQYARFAPRERLRTGTLPTPGECWMDIKKVEIG